MKMNLELVILLMFVLILNSLCALGSQPPQEEWNRTFGGSYGDRGKSVQQTIDGGFIITGTTESYGAGDEDVWLLKTDSQGNEEWSKTFGGDDYDWGESIQQTTDGGFIIAGVTSSYGAGENDIWLIKTDSRGDEEWSKTFGGSYDDRTNSIQQTKDGGFVVIGETESCKLRIDKYTYEYRRSCDDNIWLLKTDSRGNEEWNKTFGGSVGEWGESVQQTTDGGFIITGEIWTYGTGDNVWLIKTDSRGNEEWNKTFERSGTEEGYSVQQTIDAGFIIIGDTRSCVSCKTDVWLIKTDSQGNEEWSKTFGGRGWDQGYSVKQTSDGGFFITGWTDSFGTSNDDVWLMKIDSQGNEIWNKTIGESNDDRANSAQQSDDNGFIIIGETYSYGAGDYDVWLIKVKGSLETQKDEAAPTAYATIYLTNPDDDQLFINVHLDDKNIGAMDVPSGSSDLLFGKFEVTPGSHIFRMRWEDGDTGEWYETTTSENIGAGENAITLTADRHVLTSGTASVYVKNSDDDDLYVDLFVGIDRKDQKEVPSGSLKYEFGSYVLPEGSYDFKIMWTDPDTDEGYETKSSARIDADSTTEVTLAIGEHLTSKETAKVYVDNQDDDDLDISLWIDDNFKGSKVVPGESSKAFFGNYDLAFEDHDFKIIWTDPDTDESYETSVTQYISSEEIFEITLTAKKHETSTAVVNIKNKDDDEIFVMLYIDDELRNTTSLSHWTQHVEPFSLLSGTHKFVIEWWDSDTDENYNVTLMRDFEPGDMLKVNLEIAEHKATTAEVYVKNSYSKQLEMFLDIDGKFEDRKEVAPSSYMRYFGGYEVSEGSHTFEIYWEDPDTEQVSWTDATEAFEKGESKEIKLIAEKHGPALEMEVKPAFFVMEVGDKKNVDITITNTGDEAARQVDVILISKNSSVAELDKSSFFVGDIDPGEALFESSFPAQIEALKEGEATIEVKVRGKNLPEISKSIVVSVSESGSIIFKDADLGEPLEARPSSEFIEETFGPSADESDMWENAEDYITDAYSSEVLDAVLSVESSSKVGHAVEGEPIKITLELLNKDTEPIAVAMTILPPPQLVFKHEEGEYTAATQRIKQPIESIASSPKDNVILRLRDLPAFVLDETMETAEEWLWHTLHDPVQFRVEGSGLIVDPKEMLIFTSEITPEQSGWLDISGEIYYTKEPIIKYTTEAQLTTFAIETKSVEFSPDNVEHIALRKSVLVEEKECSLWGLLCW